MRHSLYPNILAEAYDSLNRGSALFFLGEPSEQDQQFCRLQDIKLHYGAGQELAGIRTKIDRVFVPCKKLGNLPRVVSRESMSMLETCKINIGNIEVCITEEIRDMFLQSRKILDTHENVATVIIAHSIRQEIETLIGSGILCFRERDVRLMPITRYLVPIYAAACRANGFRARSQQEEAIMRNNALLLTAGRSILGGCTTIPNRNTLEICRVWANPSKHGLGTVLIETLLKNTAMNQYSFIFAVTPKDTPEKSRMYPAPFQSISLRELQQQAQSAMDHVHWPQHLLSYPLTSGDDRTIFYISRII